jgi:hypothetical protein
MVVNFCFFRFSTQLLRRNKESLIDLLERRNLRQYQYNMAGRPTSGNPVKKVPIHLQSSQNRLILKSGKIVNADGITDGDVFIEDGAIK